MHSRPLTGERSELVVGFSGVGEEVVYISDEM
jgi:hypothetical protein